MLKIMIINYNNKKLPKKKLKSAGYFSCRAALKATH